jgi:hypothetical protein
VSPWSNNFLFKRFKPSCDLLITSTEIVLSQGDKAVASAALPAPTGAESLEARISQALKTITNQVHGGTSRITRNTRNTRVWLGHGLVPHGVVRMDARIMNDASISSVLKAYWEDLLDRPAGKLAITYQVQASGRSIFSSCCDLVLMDTIQAALQGSGCKPTSMAPHFSKIWNESRRQITSDNCSLLVLQDQILSIGRQHNGQWVAWTSEGCESTEWAELAFRYTRFSRSTGFDDGPSLPVWIHAPQVMAKPRSADMSHWTLLNRTSHAAPRLKELV